jgi:hypothetical protein
VESIHEEHLKRKDANGQHWLGIGYHFVIGNGNGMADGAIEPTFRWNQQLHGAHAGAADPVYNQQGIGVALVGNFESKPPTPRQLAAVKRLVRVLKGAYGIPAKNVIGHSHVKATACPGKLFPLAEVAWEPPDTLLGGLTENPELDPAGLRHPPERSTDERNLLAPPTAAKETP